jgi:hypothetical protein
MLANVNAGVKTQPSSQGAHGSISTGQKKPRRFDEAHIAHRWKSYARKWVAANSVEGDIALLVEGPSARHPEANHRMKIIGLRD